MNAVLSSGGQQAVHTLHIVLEAETIKVGTYKHCVVRVWTPSLRLAALSVQVDITEEYVMCVLNF